ncbi:hypothetical protein FQR65_LT20357 [Abscondita terminalis]|nr:hypothetical protein FQR65_LT20357 [Abscondita terminalis]
MNSQALVLNDPASLDHWACLAIGVTQVIITTGIDLRPVRVLALSAMIAASWRRPRTSAARCIPRWDRPCRSGFRCWPVRGVAAVGGERVNGSIIAIAASRPLYATLGHDGFGPWPGRATYTEAPTISMASEPYTRIGHGGGAYLGNQTSNVTWLIVYSTPGCWRAWAGVVGFGPRAATAAGGNGDVLRAGRDRRGGDRRHQSGRAGVGRITGHRASAALIPRRSWPAVSPFVGVDAYIPATSSRALITFVVAGCVHRPVPQQTQAQSVNIGYRASEFALINHCGVTWLGAPARSGVNGGLPSGLLDDPIPNGIACYKTNTPITAELCYFMTTPWPITGFQLAVVREHGLMTAAPLLIE